ncbi:MAG: tail fiber domain-containing protein [Thermoanaerobaculia bacterium]|nr:tail fiber domain-containing protein [Thermoanaerobaculia bacterium]
MYNLARSLAPGLAIVGLLAASPLVAQRSPAPAPIADVIAGTARLDFLPRQTGGGFALTVSGPEGFIEQQRFEPGRPVVFTLSGPDGSARRDGIYVYELRTRRAPAATPAASPGGEETADGRAVEIENSAKTHSPSGDSALSGTFRVLNGSILAGGLVEPRSSHGRASSSPANAGSGRTANTGRTALDVVTPDDSIIQGSLCVGLDCVNNESFGFDTIRLKENNTRIGFADTSVGAFPTNDWQLTANDSASGGADKFSIEDITGAKVPFTVTAGAATNSLFVDSTGRVGFRTATPVLDLHANTSNTPALRLEQNSSGGFTAQTWDIAGNEANFFVRDVTAGSRLPFRIRPGAPTSSIDISANGNVGIGTASPGGPLHVYGIAGKDVYGGMGPDLAAGPAFNYGYGGFSFGRSAGFLNVRPDAAATAPNPSLRFMTANVQRMIITNVGNVGIGAANPSNPLEMASGARCTAGGVWTDASSREYKQNIRDLSSEAAEETLARLSPVTYAYKAAPGELHVGFIAEDVPEIVATPDRKGLSPMDIVGVLTKVVQEQQRTIRELSERLERLEAENR